VTPRRCLPRLHTVPTPPPPALSAFLRGIEPRADVLLRALAGPDLDSAALLTRLRVEFAERAARLPLAEWPLRYWGLLLAAPELQEPASGLPQHPLYALAPTRRLVLLLRLVVGLEPAGAARVLGLSETAHQALLTDAEQKLAEAGVGPAVLLRWQEGFQQQVRAASPSRPERDPAITPAVNNPPAALNLRQAVADPPAPAQRQAAGSARLAGLRARLRRWSGSPQRWLLGLLLLLLLAALAATFRWPPSAPAPAGAVQALSTPAAPPVTALEDRLLVDPDLDLLLVAEDAPWRLGVGLLSWWSAERGDALPAPAPMASAPTVLAWSALPAVLRASLSEAEAAWPALAPDEQAALLARAERWQAASVEQRRAWLAAYAEWLARPALERATLRARHAEWRALEAGERQALDALAVAWRALPEPERQALTEAFAALPPAVREDWGLGPRLGRQLPGLRPLLAFVPAGQQFALIGAIDELDDTERAALAERIARMGTAERAALRAAVLAAEPATRSGLLRTATARPE